MKFALFEFHFLELASPSLGREWIEIHLGECSIAVRLSSPSLGREWIEMLDSGRYFICAVSLPPWGGSGLKYEMCHLYAMQNKSPSLGREWIEIESRTYRGQEQRVSLLGEGVD